MSRFEPLVWEETSVARSLEDPAEIAPSLEAKLEASLRWLESLGTKLSPGTECTHPGYTALLPNEIRLLQLKDDPKRHGIPICSFSQVLLDDIDAHPFTAISYTWIESEYSWYGYDIPRTAQIFLGDAIIEIPGHVAHILGMLSLRGFTRIWIDFLCINQADDMEKGRQVARMGRLYSSAQDVIIVLGKPTDGTDRALSDYLTDTVPGAWDEEVANHTYWSRAWIIQEIALARRLRILCGHQLLNPQSSTAYMSKLSFLRSWSMAHKPDIDYPLTYAALSHITIARTHEKTGGILAMLGDTSHCHCSDPRDALYSKLFLGNEAGIIGDPDYTITVNELYIRFAARYIQSIRTLFILNYTYGRKRDPQLPSWVPDWRPDNTSGDLREELHDFKFNKGRVFEEMGQNRSEHGIRENISPRINVTTLELVIEGVVLERASEYASLPWVPDDPTWEKPLPLVEDFLVCCLRDGIHGIVVVLGQMDDYYVLINLEIHEQVLKWAASINACRETVGKKARQLFNIK